MRYHVIADQKTVDGFALAGVQGTAIQDAQTAYRAVCCALEDSRIGTLLVSDQVEEYCRETLSEHRRKGTFPVIVTLDQKQ